MSRRATGRTLSARVDEPKGDPGNTLTRAEIEAKAVRLAEFSGAATPDEMRGAIERIYAIADAPRVGPLLADAAPRRVAEPDVPRTVSSR